MALRVWGGLHSSRRLSLFELDYRKPIIVYGFMGMFLVVLGDLAGICAIGRVARQNEKPSPEDKK